MAFNTFTWMLAPLSLLYTYVHLFWGFGVNFWIRWGANVSFASFLVLYIVGLRANLLESGISQPLKKARWYVAQVILMPLFTLMEVIGVFMAVVRPPSGFHVIRK